MKLTHLILSLTMLLAWRCGSSTYQITEPKPTLEVTSMQEGYIVDQEGYLQLRISQLGYSGTFQLSAVLTEGACELSMKGSKISTNGEWINLSSTTEILTLTPTQTGPLKLSFEVKATSGAQSGRSYINYIVQESPELQFTVEYPATASITNPIRLLVTATKNGWNGTLPVKFEQITGQGTLQYGALTIGSSGSFFLPANTTQTLYYTPEERGAHKLQLSASDGYTTDYQTLEIIVTN